MKKLFFIWALTMVLGISAEAQLCAKSSAGKTTTNVKPTTTHRISSARYRPSNQIATTFWSDDFSNPSTWTIAHEVGTTDDWVIGTTGPSGGAPISTINSATAANGFAIFDSDFMCSHNEIGNLTTTTPINCSAHPSVMLTFSQYYRRFYDSTYVFVSTNGTVWTKFAVNSTLIVNTYSGGNAAQNPNIFNLNISSVAGNQATVFIRFQFYSPSSILPGTAGCAYAWMIDDVSLGDIAPIDAGVVTPTYPETYALIPIAQVNGFGMSARMLNAGFNTLTNASMLFDVFQGNLGNNVFSGASTTVASLNPGDTTAALTPTSLYYPTDTGIYIIRYIASVAGDLVGGNDTSYAFTYVSDSMYARDYGDIDQFDYVGSYGFNGQYGSFGDVYHVFQSSQFSSSTAYVGGANIGDHISMNVYAFNAGTTGALLGTTGDYTCTAADTGGRYITLPFQSPVNVTPADYFVSFNQLDTSNIGLGATRGAFSTNSFYYSVNGGIWHSVESQGLRLCFMVRVNNPSASIVGISSPDKTAGFTIYPNPSKGLISILNKGTSGKDAIVNVMDALGKVVLTRTFGNLMNEKIDLRNQPAGVYTIQIRSSAGITTSTVVLSSK